MTDDTVSLFSIYQPIKIQTENLLCKVDPRPLRDTSCNITLKCFNKEAI